MTDLSERQGSLGLAEVVAGEDGGGEEEAKSRVFGPYSDWIARMSASPNSTMYTCNIMCHIYLGVLLLLFYFPYVSVLQIKLCACVPLSSCSHN